MILITSLHAQKRAVTDTGEEVILYDNGTWKYVKEDDQKKAEIPTNPAPFIKNKDASFQVKSKTIEISIWLNTQKWNFKKSKEGEDTEYEFNLKGKDLYAMLLTEKIEVPLESLRTVAIENAKEAAPDMEIKEEEYRTVNGKKMLYLRMDGTAQGIKFTYMGYYYSDTGGTVQFVCYTAQALVDEYKASAIELLNGLTSLK
jgi:hypothetical protein